MAPDANTPEANTPEANKPEANPPGPTVADAYNPAWAARCLLRAERTGTLATTTTGGQPFASLVTPACAPDLSLLLLLSRLSEHTRHLLADPRCCILVAGPPDTINPQTAPRVSVTGVAEMIDDPAAKARFLAIHPYAQLYADFGDFNMWRVRPREALLVGGFARAHRLKQDALAPDAAAVAAILAAEPDILAHCNRDHPDALAAIAGSAEPWHMVTADVDGFDLALGERVIRVAWCAPVQDAGDVRRELIRLARAARGG